MYNIMTVLGYLHSIESMTAIDGLGLRSMIFLHFTSQTAPLSLQPIPTTALPLMAAPLVPIMTGIPCHMTIFYWERSLSRLIPPLRPATGLP